MLMTSSTPSSNTVFTHASLDQAAGWLQAGHLLAYPTESVWGIGCDPFNKEAVLQLLALKNRPIEKGMIVVTDSAQRIAPLLASLSTTQRLAVLDSWRMASHEHTRQAHTWLLPLGDDSAHTIPSWITGSHHSVAVRVIAHPLIQALCAQMVSDTNPYGFIVSTSCNPSSHPPALTLTEAMAYFAEHTAAPVAYLQGETLGYELPSQIHDAMNGRIIR